MEDRRSALRVTVRIGCLLAAAAGIAYSGDPMAIVRLDLNSRGGALVSIEISGAARPANLAEQVSRALGCRLESVYEAPRQWNAVCPGLLRADGLQVQGWLNLAPLYSSVSNMGFPLISIIVHAPSAGLDYDAGDPWQSWNYRGDYYHTYLGYDWETYAPQPIRVKFGYTDSRWLPLLNTLLLAVLLPLLATLTLRLRARDRLRASDPYAVFGFTHSFPWVLNGAWLFWTISLGASGIPQFILYVDSASPVRTALWSTLSMGGVPLLAIFLACLAAHPVIKKTPGFGTGALRFGARTTAPFAAFILPFSLVMAGVNGLFTQPRVGFGCWLAAFLVRKALVSIKKMLHTVTVHRVLHGELYEKAQTLAARAKVRLRALYILPAGPDRQINAFASSGKTIAISQELLEHASKREVDAVIAHEIGHLSTWNVGLNMATFVGCLVFGEIYSFAVTRVGLANSWLSYAPVGPAAAILFAMWLSRYKEHEADAKSVAIAADPEALITFLAKAARMMQMPIEFSPLAGNLTTHPSVLRRAEAIARAGGIAEERLPELLRADAIPGPEQRYQIQLPEAGRNQVFSAKYQRFALNRWGLLMRATFLALGLLSAHAVKVYVFDWQGDTRTGILGAVAALPLCFAVVVAVSGSLWRFDAGRLKARLEAQFGDRPDFCVGLAPDPQPRCYTLRDEWDVGLLRLTREGLCYLGSAVRFLVPAADIRSVEIAPGVPAWWRSDRVWLWLADGTVFSLAIYSRFEWTRSADSKRLKSRIDAWLENPGSSAESAPDGTPAPQLASGGGSWITPGRVLRSWMKDSAFYMLTGLAMSVIIGEPFGWLAGVIASILDLLSDLPWLWSRDPLSPGTPAEAAVLVRNRR
jgi:Zn-dependent protease with chaperone function